MRLLFITQKIDRKDDLLGIYHEWVRRLANKCESVSVVCLYRGDYDLPPNVSVYSLGKELVHSDGGVSVTEDRVSYAKRFFSVLKQLNGKYDAVFVHMNPEYVILGWPVWFLNRKKIIFWYNHPQAFCRARIAFALSSVVLHTSPFAYAARLRKAVKMPVGIDITNFSWRVAPPKTDRLRMVYVGRISPVKRIDVLFKALGICARLGMDFSLQIYGKPLDREEDKNYEKELRLLAKLEGIEQKIFYKGAVPNSQVPEVYSGADCSVNVTDTGSMDKAIFEAMSIGVPVITSNGALKNIVPDGLYCDGNPDSLSKALMSFSRKDDQERKNISVLCRKIVEESHSLDALIEKLMKQFSDSSL